MDGEEIRWNNSQQFHANHVFFLRIEFRRHRFRRLTKKTKKKKRKNRIVACLIDDNLGQLLNWSRRKNPRNIKPQKAEEVARQKNSYFPSLRNSKKKWINFDNLSSLGRSETRAFSQTTKKNDREKILQWNENLERPRHSLELKWKCLSLRTFPTKISTLWPSVC